MGHTICGIVGIADISSANGIAANEKRVSSLLYPLEGQVCVWNCRFSK